MKKQYNKLFFLEMIIFFSVAHLFAQGPDTLWTKTYGGSDYDFGESVQQTSDNGYIISGGTKSFGPGTPSYPNVYLVKTDSLGDTLWTKTYGGIRDDVGWSVQQTSDNGYIITGRTYSFGIGTPSDCNVWLIKTDSLGDTLWTKTYGGTNGDQGFSVQQTTDGGYIVVGCTNSFGAGQGDAWLIKTDSLGDTLWTKTYGDGYSDDSHSVQQTTDGGYIVTGRISSFGNSDLWLIKTDSIGDTLWTKTYGGSDVDNGLSVQQTSDNGYIITGFTASFGPGTPSYSNVYIVKTDSLGDTLWTKTFGGDSMDMGWSVQQTSGNGYIIAGYTTSLGAGQPDVWIIRTDSLGDTVWTKTYGGTDSDCANSLQQTTDGGYIIAGLTNSFGVGAPPCSNFWLIKMIENIPPFNLISPSDSSMLSTRRPTFIWESSPHPNRIKSYEVYIDDTLRDSVINTDTIWTADYDLSDGFHNWYIMAYDIYNDSAQSNQIWTVFIDASPPLIDSTTVWSDTSYAGPFPVYTKITDISAINTALLYFKRTEDPVWFSTEMISGANNWYYGEIPQVFSPDDTVKYYIYARDALQPANESTDPPGAPANYYSFIANAVRIEESFTGSDIDRFSFSVNSPAKGKILFKFSLPEKSRISLKIYDIAGRLISVSLDGEYSRGSYKIPFKPERKGIYFYKLKSPYQRKTGKVVIF